MQAEAEVQTATADFFFPIAVAYLAVCGTWLALRRAARSRWPLDPDQTTNRKWLDFALTFVAIAGAFGLGQAYRQDWLLPSLPGSWANLSSAANLCLPYSPILVILILRRQSLATVWISAHQLHWKLAAGAAASIVGLLVFLAMRMEMNRIPEIVSRSVRAESLTHAPAVFLEAVAVAYIFVRLRWVAGASIAIALPCLLFAAAHIPGGIQSGRSLAELIAFFLFNSVLAAVIFSVVMKSRDVVWIAIPHYVLDIAINAFE